MPATVNIGTLEGLLRWKADDTELNKSLDTVAKKADVSRSQLSKYNRELSAADSAYRRVAAALNPVTANTNRYEAAQKALNNALRLGIISQSQYNTQLSLAKTKYLEAAVGASRFELFTSNIGKALISQIGTYIGITAAIGGAVALIGQFVSANLEAEESSRRVEAAVARSFSGVSAGEINELANSLSILSGVDDELIANAQAKALVFNRIGSEIFPRYSRAALDMGIVEGDIAAAFERTGKIINQPLKGLTLLERSGYAVAKSQSDMVKEFVRSGDILSAQGVLLDIIEGQYGGAAEAARDTLGGALRALKVNFENLFEAIGEGNLGPFRDSVELLNDVLVTLTTDILPTATRGYLEFKNDVIAANLAIFSTVEQGLRFLPGAEQRAANVSALRRELAESGIEMVNAHLGIEQSTKQASRGTIELTNAESKLNQESSKVASILNNVSEAVIRYNETLGDTIATVSSSLKRETDLADALAKGEVAYSLAVDAADRAKAVESERLKLTRAHRAEIEKLNESRSKLLALGRASEASKVSETIDAETKAFERQIEVIADTVGTAKDLDKQNRRGIDTLREGQDERNEYLTAIAEIEDALSGTTLASLENAIAIESETKAIDKQAEKGSDLAKAIEKETRLRLTRLDVLKREAQALRVSTSIRQEAEFKSRVVGIDPSLSAAARELEVQFLSTLRNMGEGSIAEGERVLTRLSEKYGITAEEIKRNLASIADSDFVLQVREDLKSPIDRYREYIELVELSSLTVIEKQRVINDTQSQFLTEYTSSWASLFSTLSNLFGGFAGEAISSIQRMISTAQQLQSIGNSIGGSAGSMISSAGPFLAVVGEIYGAQRRSIARSRQQRYTSGVTLGFGGDEEEVFGRRGRAITEQLESTLTDILAILGRTLSIIPEITLQAREDGRGFRLTVGSIVNEVFSTLEEAINAAAIEVARNLSGDSTLSQTIRTILANTNAQTAEELTRDLNFAQWYDSIGLGELPKRIRDLMLEFTRAMEMGDQLGLDTNRIVDWFSDSVERVKAELLGIDLSAADSLRNLRALRDGMREVTSVQRQAQIDQINALREQISILRQAQERGGGAGAGGSGEGGTGGGRGGSRFGSGSGVGGATKEVTDEIRRLEEELARLESQLSSTGDAMSELELDMGITDVLMRYLGEQRRYDEDAIKLAKFKVQIEFDRIRRELELLGKFEQFAGMFNDAFNAAMRDAERGARGRGGAGRGSDRDGVRSFIDDRTFELGLRGLTDYQRAIAELSRTYDEQLKQAGRDQKLRTELLALKERELEILRQEAIGSVVEKFQDFIGVLSPFDEIQKSAESLIKDINESPLGDARKGQMVSRVLAGMNAQLDKLAKEKTLSLFNELAGDLEKYGASELETLDLRKAAATLEHTLKMEHYRAEIEILRASGKVSKETLAILDDAFRKLGGIDPTKGIDGDPVIRFKGYDDAISETVTHTSDELNRLAEAFKDAKDDIRSLLGEIARGELGIVSPEDAFRAAKEQYDSVISRAQAGELVGFQESSSAARNFIEALKSFSPALAAVELPKIQSTLTGLLNSTEVRDQNVIYSEQFVEKQQETNRLLLGGFNLLSSNAQEQTTNLEQIVSQLEKVNITNVDLAARIAQIESAKLAVKSG